MCWTSRRGLLLIALLCATAAAAGTLTARWRSQARTPESETTPNPLSIDPRELDLGVQYETPAFDHKFTLTNVSNRPVKILSMASTCDCLRLVPAGELMIAPGASREVIATLALRMTSGCQRQRGQSEPSVIPLRVTFRGPDRSTRDQVWVLTCDVRPALRLAAGTLTLGMQSLRQQRVEQHVGVEVADHVTRVEVSPSRRWVVDLPDDLGSATRSARITLRASHPLISGEFDDHIVFTPIDKEGRRLPESTLRLTGEFVPDVGCVPRELRFGRVRLGGVVEDTIYWRSLTDQTFTVRSIRSDNPEVKVGPVELVGGRPCCRVTRRVSKFGEQTDSLHVEVAEGDGRVAVHTVPLFVVGVGD